MQALGRRFRGSGDYRKQALLGVGCCGSRLHPRRHEVLSAPARHCAGAPLAKRAGRLPVRAIEEGVEAAFRVEPVVERDLENRLPGIVRKVTAHCAQAPVVDVRAKARRKVLVEMVREVPAARRQDAWRALARSGARRGRGPRAASSPRGDAKSPQPLRPHSGLRGPRTTARGTPSGAW